MRGVGIALVLLAMTPFAALAHERRAVDKYSFLVGFNVEPAIQGQPNGPQLTVTSPTENNRGVEGLATTLKFTVAYGGGQPKEFPLRAVSGTPGRYVADFIPTRAGTYLFTFTGAIEGIPVNERFESGPGRFSDVVDVTALQFPEPVPLANEAARQAQAAAGQVEQVQADVSQTRTISVAGLGVGAVGIVLALVALVVAANRRGPAPS